MQRTRVTVRVDASPIIDSKRGVTGLLNLGDQQARADGVHRPGGNKDAVAGVGFERVQRALGLAVSDRLLE